jgi:hypothetical protein
MAARRHNGVGPIYRHLLASEMAADARYRRLGRPRLLLEKLQAGETVEVEFWRLPRGLLPPGCGSRVLVTPDM